MSQSSIYETRWIDLVFQYRNQEYGAYQLRKESTKTTLMALFMGLLLVTSALSIPVLLTYFNPENQIAPPEVPPTIVNVTDLPPQVLPPIARPALAQPKTQHKALPVESQQLLHPEIVPAAQATAPIAKNTENTPVTTAATEGTAALNPSSSNGTLGLPTAAADQGNAIVAAATLDQLPEFPGGIQRFYTYVGNNFEKPDLDTGSTIKVYVSFVIEKDGSMTDIQVKRDPGYGLGKEAVRVLRSLKTKWSPGMIDAKPVRTAYNLPITVQMN